MALKNLPREEWVFMLSLEKTKELLGRPNMSDAEAEEVRLYAYALADIVFEKLHTDLSTKKDDHGDAGELRTDRGGG